MRHYDGHFGPLGRSPRGIQVGVWNRPSHVVNEHCLSGSAYDARLRYAEKMHSRRCSLFSAKINKTTGRSHGDFEIGGGLGCKESSQNLLEFITKSFRQTREFRRLWNHIPDGKVWPVRSCIGRTRHRFCVHGAVAAADENGPCASHDTRVRTTTSTSCFQQAIYKWNCYDCGGGGSRAGNARLRVRCDAGHRRRRPV